VEVFLGELEKNPVLQVEFLARQMHHGQQAALGFFARPCGHDQLQPAADGAVFVLDLLEFAHLIEARSEAVEEQVVFEIGVRLQRGVEHSGHGFDFTDGPGEGHGLFEMIQLRIEDGVFGNEGVGDFHDSQPSGFKVIGTKVGRLSQSPGSNWQLAISAVASLGPLRKHGPVMAVESFQASRWTQGNFLFPTVIEITDTAIIRRKRSWFRRDEISIALPKVASVHIKTGLIWSDILIESSGGTDPLASHGHRKGDARRIRELVETYQATQGVERGA